MIVRGGGVEHPRNQTYLVGYQHCIHHRLGAALTGRMLSDSRRLRIRGLWVEAIKLASRVLSGRSLPQANDCSVVEAYCGAFAGGGDE